MEEQKAPEQQVSPADLNPQNLAVNLKNNIDKFAVMVSEYTGSKKQLQRVLVALAMHPFEERPFYSVYNQERELFQLGLQINSDKLLFLYLSFEEQKKVEEIKAKALAQQTENNKETENGETS